MFQPLVQWRRPTVGVVLADDAVHVAVARSSDPRTAEAPVDNDPQRRSAALQTLCRKLGVIGQRAAVAISEDAVRRTRLPLPTHLRAAERNAVVRLHVRRQLPLPPSRWRYRVVPPDRPGQADHRLLAARADALDAARRLLREAGLRPAAAVAVGDTRPHWADRDAPPNGTVLAEAVLRAAKGGAPNLFRTVPAAAASHHGRAVIRAMGLATALALGAVAVRVHFWTPPQASPAFDPVAETAAETASRDPAGARSAPATPADPRPGADARRRALPGWLDAVAEARPEQTRLTELHLHDEELRLHGLAPDPATATAYLAVLEAPLSHGRLLALEATSGAVAFRLGLAVPFPAPRVEPDPRPAEGQPGSSGPDPGWWAADLARRMLEAGLVLGAAEPAPSGGPAPLIRLRAQGGYAAVHRFLSALAHEEEILYEPRRLHLTATDGTLRIAMEVRVWPDPEESR